MGEAVSQQWVLSRGIQTFWQGKAQQDTPKLRELKPRQQDKDAAETEDKRPAPRGSSTAEKQETTEKQSRRFAVSLIVNNHFGVLNRISGLYAKRCYNIDALSVGETDDPQFSRMTIVSTGDSYMQEQVVHQLEKLIDVRDVRLLPAEKTAFAQHLFIKLHLSDEAEQKQNLLELITRYRGRIIDFGASHLTAELTGTADEMDGFIQKARAFEILELSRSGDIAIGLGIENTLRVNSCAVECAAL